MTIIDNLLKTVAGKLDIYETFLKDGATEKSVKDITEITGLEVPDALAELLLRHNGEKKFMGFLGHGFLSAEEIISQWQSIVAMKNDPNFDVGERMYYQQDLIAPVSFFSAKRLPFAHDGSGQLLCIDYDPGPDGKMGQIVYVPMGEPEPLSVIAGSFHEFVEFITEAISSGNLALADDREDYEADEQHFAEVYFYQTWKQDWTEVAKAYHPKN
ncbi:MAG: SMI1/KNR4 family protein [Bacteroidota bacterium]